MNAKRMAYLPGLDGLRAIAVAAVVLYHAGLHWLPGGFLGVEVFFVISGFLITSLLVAEWDELGRIDLTGFWLKRARRLLPAVFTMILVSLVFVDVFLPGEVAGLRKDALASFGYVTNWYLVFEHKSYFEAVGRPPLLQHLWSLAVEEQFYLLWPLFLTFALGRWRRQHVRLVVIAGALASAMLMAALYQPDVDPSRLYYGTDTRAAGLLVGAALALTLAPSRMNRGSAAMLDALGFVALGVLTGFFLWLGEFQPWLYRGGFLLVSVVTATVIVTATHPRARLFPGLLSWRPVRWIGLRSYGIYLWHWPIVTVTRPQIDVPISGLPLLALQLVAVGVVAELSYRYVETPVRNGALGRGWNAICGAWRTWRGTRGFQRWWLGMRWVTATGTVVACVGVFGTSVAFAQPAAKPSYLAVESVHTSFAPRTTAVSPGADRAEARASMFSRASGTEATPTASRILSANGVRVTAIGDSVMVGAADALEEDVGASDEIDVDARIGRQASEAIDVLQSQEEAGELGDVVVIQVGNNGTFSADQFDEMMDVLGSNRQVVFVNVKVPRDWQDANNEVIADGVNRYPNAFLVDWYDASVNRPELFWDDGIHLRPEGASVYASLIAAAIQADE